MTGTERENERVRELRQQVRFLIVDALDRDVPDFQTLKAWRDRDLDHRIALRRELELWHLLGPATAAAARKATAAARADTLAVDRRKFLRKGAVASAAAAAAAAVCIYRPPFGLWPSAAELSADVHTATGERLTIPRTSGIVVQANTQTSLNFKPTGDGVDAFEILAGEVAVDMTLGQTEIVIVHAGATVTHATGAVFSIRLEPSGTRVTCVRGTVSVQREQAAIVVPPEAQVLWAPNTSPDPTPVNAENATAWRKGFLIFDGIPLWRVIEEVNRYRTGRIVVLNRALSERLVNARFRLDRIDEIISEVSNAFGAKSVTLPGNLVFLT